jgi:UDP-N-acetyl-D-mannosaminuronate dehydrogenase
MTVWGICSLSNCEINDKEGISGMGYALMLGITFKENCPDVRNTKIVDALTDYGISVTIYDPWPVPKRSKGIQISHLKYGSKSKV